MLQQAWSGVLGLFYARSVTRRLAAPPAEHGNKPVPAKSSKQAPAEVHETHGEWTARELFAYAEKVFKRLEQRSENFYGKPTFPRNFYDNDVVMAKVGVYIPHGSERTKATLSPADLKAYGMPALFMVGFPSAEATKESIPASFMSAVKMRGKLPGVEPAQKGEVVYQISVAYSEDERGQHLPVGLYWDRAFIAIDPRTAIARTLKHKVVRYADIRTRRNGLVHVPQLIWDKPMFGELRPEPVHIAFNMALLLWFNKEYHWQVRLKDTAGRCISIGIGDKRIQRIFRDRDVFATTPTGKRSPILHFVSAHTRQIGAGRTTNVRMHVRGETYFKWNKMVVHIVLPGKTAVSTAAFTVASVDAKMARKNKRDSLLSDDEMAKKVIPMLDSYHYRGGKVNG